MNIEIVLTGVVALIPISIWAYFFYKTRSADKIMLFLAFVAGCFSAGILLFYQQQWGQSLNLIFLDVTPVNFTQSLAEFSKTHLIQRALIFIFGVGMMEEFIKHFVIRKEKPTGLVLLLIFFLFVKTIQVLYSLIIGTIELTDIYLLGSFWATFYIFVLLNKKLNLKSIDQVILISLMSALGFAFVENIIYLQKIMAVPGASVRDFAGLFVLRSFFTVMVHVLCSGIFGYYYGISLFAGPYLQKHYLEKKVSWFVRFLRKILQFSQKTTFKELMLIRGLLSAMLIHGFYNFILDINISLGDLFGIIGIQGAPDLPLHIIVMNVYLVAGFWYLRAILTEKENHYKFGLVGTRMLPEHDYAQLIKKIKNLDNKQQVEKQLLEKNWATKDEMSELKKKIAYIKKYNLLEEKYTNNKWISLERFKKFRQTVDEIENIQEIRKSTENN